MLSGVPKIYHFTVVNSSIRLSAVKMPENKLQIKFENKEEAIHFLNWTATLNIAFDGEQAIDDLNSLPADNLALVLDQELFWTFLDKNREESVPREIDSKDRPNHFVNYDLDRFIGFIELNIEARVMLNKNVQITVYKTEAPKKLVLQRVDVLSDNRAVYQLTDLIQIMKKLAMILQVVEPEYQQHRSTKGLAYDHDALVGFLKQLITRYNTQALLTIVVKEAIDLSLDKTNLESKSNDSTEEFTRSMSRLAERCQQTFDLEKYLAKCEMRTFVSLHPNRRFKIELLYDDEDTIQCRFSTLALANHFISSLALQKNAPKGLTVQIDKVFRGHSIMTGRPAYYVTLSSHQLTALIASQSTISDYRTNANSKDFLYNDSDSEDEVIWGSSLHI